MFRIKKTLNGRAKKLHRKAVKIERHALIIVENEAADGFNVHVSGTIWQLSEMLAVAASENEKFADILDAALNKISVERANVLLKHYNPFQKK